MDTPNGACDNNFEGVDYYGTCCRTSIYFG